MQTDRRRNQSEARSGAVFRSTTRLEQISAIAQNKQGQPVRDLHEEEFQALEDGILPQVRLFSERDGESRHFTGTDDPGVFTNRIAGSRATYVAAALFQRR